jgi:hypothetical protein
MGCIDAAEFDGMLVQHRGCAADGDQITGASEIAGAGTASLGPAKEDRALVSHGRIDRRKWRL